METSVPLKRNEALELLETYLSDETLVKHSLATEAIMRGLAAELGEDETAWGLAGLLHDIDFEETRTAPEKHAVQGAEILREAGFPDWFVHAVRSHNSEFTGVEPESKLDFALICAENATGLIVASALVRPDKKLEGLKVKSVRKKFKDKSFARNVPRKSIELCSELGLELSSFLALSIRAMQEIHIELGL